MLDGKSNTIRAQSITFLLKQNYICVLGGTAMIQRTPHLTKGPNGWVGGVHADARDLVVDSGTQLKFLPESHDQDFTVVSTNMFVAYVGKLMLDGSIHLDRAAFWSNEVDSDELKMRERDEPLIAAADPAHKATATLAIGSGKPMMLAGNDDLRTRVSEIGRKLVPEYQKVLPASDPTKINFRFYVVHDKRKMVRDALNGTILIPDTLLRTVRNEAQLAALLSVAVAQVVEKQELQSRHRRRLQQVSGWLLTGVGSDPNSIRIIRIAGPDREQHNLQELSPGDDATGRQNRLGVHDCIGLRPARSAGSVESDSSEASREVRQVARTRDVCADRAGDDYWRSDFNGLRVGAEFGEWSKELN